MKKVIDIIIPAYNAHNTIAITLSSIAAQTMVKQLRVTIVNDCSDKDYSAEVAMFSKIMDVREIILKEHHGCGRTRNVGLDAATYPYIMFIDSDDVYKDAFSIENLYKKMISGDYNVVYGAMLEYKSKEDYIYPIYSDHSIWILGAIFKLDFLNQNGIRFFDSSRGEDTGFNKVVKLLSRVEQIGYIDDYVYMWTDYNSDNRINDKEFMETGSRLGYAENLISAYNFIKDKKLPYDERVRRLDYAANIVSVYFLSIIMDNKTNNGHLLREAFQEYYRTQSVIFDKFLTEEDYYKVYDANYRSHFVVEPYPKNPIKFDDYIAEIASSAPITFPKINEKKENPFFSIIIPCYNCSKTIERLLNSILYNHFTLENMEILIVDDNSTDNFIEKVKPYENKLNIRYFKTKEEEEHCPGNTRQVGLDNAKGEWIMFIDSDDYLVENCLVKVYNLIHSEKLNEVCFTNIVEYDVDYDEELHHNFDRDIWLHGKFYNRNFLQTYNIRFKKNLVTHEDTYFNNQVYVTLDALGVNYKYYPLVSYVWVFNRESLSRKGFSAENCYVEFYFDDFFKGFDSCFDMVEKFPHCEQSAKIKLIVGLLKGFFFHQSSLYKLGYNNEMVQKNYQLLCNFKHKVLSVVNKNDIITFIYSDPISYHSIRQLCGDNSFHFVEMESFTEFISRED